MPDQNQASASHYRLERSDGGEDLMTRQCFSNYDDAYDALERYCSSFCCSDDDRIEYSIKANDTNPETSAD